MRVLSEKTSSGHMFRLMSGYGESAYVIFGLNGLQAEVEFPSDWHEEARAWVRIGLGFCKIAFSFPWKWTVPDDYQCSGPTYGFNFFDDLLFIRWGKAHGKRDDPSKAIYMPWAWRHKEHKILSEPETHTYIYVLKSGEVQNRTATIKVETRLWKRWWIPHTLFKKTIDVLFDHEVGEKSGSWKGGCIGCGWDMKEGETPLDTLRRMELERKF